MKNGNGNKNIKAVRATEPKFKEDHQINHTSDSFIKGNKLA